MTVYARSDMMFVTIPADGGGCGSGHGRPVVAGAPAKLWRLDCPYCEVFLRTDPCWSTSSLEIPLTPDEERVAKKLEAEGDKVMHQVSAALARSSIEGLRTAQAGELDLQKAAQERDELQKNYAHAMAELERLSRIIEQRPDMGEPVKPEPVPVAEPVTPRTWVYPVADPVPRAEGSVLNAAPVTASDVPETFHMPAPGSQAPAPVPPPRPVVKGTDTEVKAARPATCPSCGGPMRKPGSRGPTPKFVCLDCKAKGLTA